MRNEVVAEKIFGDSQSCDLCVVSARSSGTHMRVMPREPGDGRL